MLAIGVLHHDPGHTAAYALSSPETRGKPPQQPTSCPHSKPERSGLEKQQLFETRSPCASCRGFVIFRRRLHWVSRVWGPVKPPSDTWFVRSPLRYHAIWSIVLCTAGAFRERGRLPPGRARGFLLAGRRLEPGPEAGQGNLLPRSGGTGFRPGRGCRRNHVGHLAPPGL